MKEDGDDYKVGFASLAFFCFVAVIVLLIIIFILSRANASVLDPGETGAVFLKIGTNAAAVGMGEAYTAFPAGVNSLNYNPAGIISGADNPQLLFTHIEWFEGIRYEYIGYVHPLGGDFGAIGGEISGLHTSMEDKIGGAPGLAEGWIMKDGYFVPEGPSYTAVDSSLAVFYANEVRFPGENIFDVGIALRGILQQLDIFSSFGGGLDLGVIYFAKEPTWFSAVPDFVKPAIPSCIGVALRNIGGIGAARQGGEGSLLPASLAVGVGYDFNFLRDDELKLGVDFEQLIDNFPLLEVGAEYGYNIINVKMQTGIEAGDFKPAIRLGYKLGGGIQNDLGFLAGLNAGLGFGITIEPIRVELDYALSPQGILSQDSLIGSTHRISLILKFGEKVIKRKALPASP